MAKNIVQQEPQEPQTITIPLATAKQLLELYDNCEAADSHFKLCQSDLFREHMVSCYQAKLVQNAFAELREKIENP